MRVKAGAAALLQGALLAELPELRLCIVVGCVCTLWVPASSGKEGTSGSRRHRLQRRLIASGRVGKIFPGAAAMWPRPIGLEVSAGRLAARVPFFFGGRTALPDSDKRSGRLKADPVPRRGPEGEKSEWACWWESDLLGEPGDGGTGWSGEGGRPRWWEGEPRGSKRADEQRG